MGRMRFSLLRACVTAGFAVLAGACSSCYNDRFCQDLIGKTDEELVALLGKPTGEYKRGETTSMEWYYDASYNRMRVVDDFYGPWRRDRFGYMYYPYWPPYVVNETVSKMSYLQVNLVKGRVVNCNSRFSDSGMCNFFIPENYLERYRRETRERTY